MNRVPARERFGGAALSLLMSLTLGQHCVSGSTLGSGFMQISHTSIEKIKVVCETSDILITLAKMSLRSILVNGLWFPPLSSCRFATLRITAAMRRFATFRQSKNFVFVLSERRIAASR